MPISIAPAAMSNQEFLEAHAKAGCIGLVGGPTLCGRIIGRAQRSLVAGRQPSRWGHAFLFQGKRADGQHWVIESDIEVQHKRIILGVQENRISKYFNAKDNGSLAVLDFGLSADETKCLMATALDIVADRARYSIAELAGTLLALRVAPLRGRDNLLARRRSFYCSAFVHHVFRSAGVDLVPGVPDKHTTPEDLWQSLKEHECHLLDRTPSVRRPTMVRRFRTRLRGA